MQHNFIAFRERSKCSASLFDVFSIWSSFFFPSKERECKTKVYIFLVLWEQLRLHNVLIVEKKQRKQRDLGFFVWIVLLLCRYKARVSIPLTARRGRTAARSQSGSYGIILKAADRPYVNSLSSPVLMDSLTRRKVSGCDSDWQIEGAMLLQC